MQRFNDDTVQVLAQTEAMVVGKTMLQHGTARVETEVYVLIQVEGDARRYYTSSVVARAASREITEHKATLATLTTNFNGRSKVDMQKFLDINHVAMKAAKAKAA